MAEGIRDPSAHLSLVALLPATLLPCWCNKQEQEVRGALNTHSSLLPTPHSFLAGKTAASMASNLLFIVNNVIVWGSNSCLWNQYQATWSSLSVPAFAGGARRKRSRRRKRRGRRGDESGARTGVGG